MPTYLYRCEIDGEYEVSRSIHDDGVSEPCPACTVPGVMVFTPPRISASATPSSRPETAEAVRRERRWDVDHAAYRRLRKEGIQPAHVDGSAHFEKHADSTFEFDMGRLYPDKKELKRAVELNGEVFNADVPA